MTRSSYIGVITVSCHPISITSAERRPADTVQRTGAEKYVIVGGWNCVKMVFVMVLMRIVGRSGGSGRTTFFVFESTSKYLSMKHCN